MSEHAVNAFGQPLGPLVAEALPRPLPMHTALEGRYCTLRLPNPTADAAPLAAAFTAPGGAQGWTYLPYGPFPDTAAFGAWMQATCTGQDPHFYTIEAKGLGPAGQIAFLRIFPDLGAIEIGHVHFAPAIQRSRVATEAVFLMMACAFDTLGYCRLEWKCDALNAASMRAARRLGFLPEGIFRKSRIVKGRWRDTAWFALTDADWPERRAAFTAWLDPGNFTHTGAQIRPLNMPGP